MEDAVHCKIHHERLAEYMCLICKNLPLCKLCKQDHEIGTGHMHENLREVGLTIMHQCIQYGRLENELAEGMMKIAKEFEAGLQREVDRLQSSCVQNNERCSKMKKLDSEGRYAELYFYVKSLSAGGAKSKAATGELNKRLLETLDTASDRLKKVLSKFEYKPVFAEYEKDEVFVFKGESERNEEIVIFALKNADMQMRTKIKALYINSWLAVGDPVALELAFRLQAHPISALYLTGSGISDAGAEVLARAVLRNKSLSAICISSKNISDTGTRAVAEAAQNCRSLTTFYFASLEITDSGAQTVAMAVKDCPLSVFYLGGVKISDAGAAAVTDVVKGCPLSAFCLAINAMSDVGAIHVANAVNNCQLSALYLLGNHISDAGATAVAEIISSGGCASTLSAFCLVSASISDSGTRKVTDAIKDCTLLSSFYIDGQPISGETLAHIFEGVISTTRSMNLCIGGISKEQMDFYLDRLQKSGVAKQLKLRFQCGTEPAKGVCKKFEAEWNAKLAEFRVVQFISSLFIEDVIIGVPK